MSWCDDLWPQHLLSREVCLSSKAWSEDILNRELTPTVNSMKNFCNFLSCPTGMVCNSFMLKDSSSFSRFISAISCSSSCIGVYPPSSDLSSFFCATGLLSWFCSLADFDCCLDFLLSLSWFPFLCRFSMSSSFGIQLRMSKEFLVGIF